MRRAGYAVRVLPVEGGSWEENPTDACLEFIRRDLRWCQGNMQYLRLLGLPGLRPVSRVQLVLAILMFLASPAWVALMTLSGPALRSGRRPRGPWWTADLGLDALRSHHDHGLRPQARDPDRSAPDPGRPAGLWWRLARPDKHPDGGPGLHPAGPGDGHCPQPVYRRTDDGARAWPGEPSAAPATGSTWGEALTELWPQTLVGLSALLWLGATAGAMAFWFSPFFLGALLAVPLAVVSATPWLGRHLTRLGLWRIPEETAPEPLLRALGLSALAALQSNQSHTTTDARLSPSGQQVGQQGDLVTGGGRHLVTVRPGALATAGAGPGSTRDQ